MENLTNFVVALVALILAASIYRIVGGARSRGQGSDQTHMSHATKHKRKAIAGCGS